MKLTLYSNFNLFRTNHVSVLKASNFEYGFGFTNSEPIAYKGLFKHLTNPYVSDPDFLSHEFLKYALGCINVVLIDNSWTTTSNTWNGR